jgi:hypothetical protein
MQLIGRNSYDWTIFFVQGRELEGILATKNGVVVESLPGYMDLLVFW